ncbi:alpha/beta-hydrolase [Fomitiporia mediterranea MF3/22]|uniref:alpha/beta-hydrolase n=1 Tax=Fomitiporia mediterranea (strain MF3/22) TaxID=694068 RepID=UPI00044075F6|nr:alpha/beta-hydrolase [Fomitiporia mediterranea MF3/22]EJC98204.1 alpha/beta-hydrolase [Fomitiporia mediterranea MF3/22]
MPFLKVSDSVTFHYIIPSCPDHDRQYLDPKKPTVLLLHPRLFDSYFFTPQWHDARLARGYNLLAIDHHYHGKTNAVVDDKPYDFMMVAADLLQALDKLGVKKCHIFGNSLGAPIAFRMYILRPNTVESMILCGKHPPVETEENKGQYRSLRDACLDYDDDGNDKLASDVVYGLHYIYFGEETGADAIIEEWVATSNFRPSNQKLIKKIFSSLLDRTPLCPEQVASVTCPVLIIHGEADVPYPPSVAHEIYDSMPNAKRELVIIPGAPHFLSWTHAQEVNDVVVSFLDRITGVDSEALGHLPINFAALHKKTPFWKKLVI